MTAYIFYYSLELCAIFPNFVSRVRFDPAWIMDTPKCTTVDQLQQSLGPTAEARLGTQGRMCRLLV